MTSLNSKYDNLATATTHSHLSGVSLNKNVAGDERNQLNQQAAGTQGVFLDKQGAMYDVNQLNHQAAR